MRHAMWWAPAQINIGQPNVSRVYDFHLGGNRHFAADREFARQARLLFPAVDTAARSNRAFVRRAVRSLAMSGVRQFLDLGCGLPGIGNVHETAREVDPAARVIYVDSDPLAIAQMQLLLADKDNADIVPADIRDTDYILGHPITRGLLDFDRPIALLLCAVLHFVADADRPQRLVAAYRDVLAPGSYLTVSHGASDACAAARVCGEAYRDTATPVRLRGRTEVRALFDGFDLLAPGLTFTSHWRPEHPENILPPDQCAAYAGVGRLAR